MAVQQKRGIQEIDTPGRLDYASLHSGYKRKVALG
jgi:hypothetical protein